MAKKYIITELLALRGNAAIDISQFTVYALENNLLRRKRCPANTDPETSSIPPRYDGHTTSSSEDSFQRSALQPRNGSQENDGRSDAGFVKFLKQHTSPKHRRVTPGGRVVPFDSSFPIPEFKPPPLTTFEGCPTKNGKEPAKIVNSQGASKETKIAQSSGMSATAKGFKFDPSSSGSLVNATANSSEEIGSQMATSYQSLQSLQQLQIPPTRSDLYFQQPLVWAPTLCPIIQVPQSGQETLGTPNPQLLLPEAIACYQNGPLSHMNQNSVLQNLPQQQPAPLVPAVWSGAAKLGPPAPVIGLTDPHVTATASYSFANPNAFASQPAPPLASFPGSLSAYVADQDTQRSLQDVTKEYQSLSSQLANLDRYMAIHTFEMNLETKNNLVEQRRSLVKDLDMARRYKEHLESSIKKLPPTGIELLSMQGFQPDLVNDWKFSSNPAVSRLFAVEQPADHPLPSTLSSFNTTTLPFPPNGYVTVNTSLPNWGEYPYDSYLSQEVQSIPQTYQLPHQINNISTVSQPNIPNQLKLFEDSKGPTLANFSQLHRQIEAAARKGEPVDGLFNELARVTEQSVVQRNVQKPSSFAAVQPNSIGSDKTNNTVQKSLHASQREVQRGGAQIGVSDNLDTGISTSKSSSSGWIVVDKRTEDTSGTSQLHASPHKGPIQSHPGTRLERDLITNKQLLQTLRHSRDVRGRGSTNELGDRKGSKQFHGNRSMILTPWAFRTDMDVAASKACAPVISRVNAHGFLPSLDGANDFHKDNAHLSGPLIDFATHQNVQQNSTSHQPWYLKVPRPGPSCSEVRQFFKDIEVDESRVINTYQAKSMKGQVVARKG